MEGHSVPASWILSFVAMIQQAHQEPMYYNMCRKIYRLLFIKPLSNPSWSFWPKLTLKSCTLRSLVSHARADPVSTRCTLPCSPDSLSHPKTAKVRQSKKRYQKAISTPPNYVQCLSLGHFKSYWWNSGDSLFLIVQTQERLSYVFERNCSKRYPS